ncbi:hypothetical protein pEaSNUABM17_00112 [Erwinia phage pEa_SNUABM_17]|uniref:Uncharacterized protein n=1 Tax=Erwinia phage pEa_SNUABM_17 TaxID=2869545 RepID=A0AAE8C3J8_9CAUD|nr:hypothetical protein MPK72_gp112 [Erwinia phage pEa_SNUABM_17]QZE57658.1 hypothetical protein pEaSNUABM17_00112 [Erwinia phage pEa_SNUABM_17]
MILFFVSLIAIAMLGRLLSGSESHILLPWRAASLSVINSGSVASAMWHLHRA